MELVLFALSLAAGGAALVGIGWMIVRGVAVPAAAFLTCAAVLATLTATMRADLDTASAYALAATLLGALWVGLANGERHRRQLERASADAP